MEALFKFRLPKSILLVWFALVSLCTAQTANVFIQPVEQNINVDSSIFVTISISDVTDIHAYSITLPYEGTLVEITDVTELDFFSPHSALFFPTINSAQNSLLVNAAILGNNTQTGSGNLFKIEFKAMAAGEVNLNLQNIILRDSQNNDIPFTASGGIIRISPVTSLVESDKVKQNLNALRNYPNPFNNSTVINYFSNYGKQINFKVFSILGKEVYSEKDENMFIGEHKFNWNGKNNFGASLSSGIYLVIVQEENKIFSRKITLLK